MMPTTQRVPSAIQILEEVAARHREAAAAMRQASEDRAVAVAQARKAGASLGVLAEVLGMARPTVLELARTGERILNGETR